MEHYPTRPHTPFTKQNVLLMKKMAKLRRKTRKAARKAKMEPEQEDWEGLIKSHDESSFKDTRRLDARGVRAEFAPLPKRRVTNILKPDADRGGTKRKSNKRKSRKRKSRKRKSIKRKIIKRKIIKRKSRKHKRR